MREYGLEYHTREDRPISVGVTVDLELAEDAGGHVKCWQRLAEAAACGGSRVDLTVYFLGAEPRTIALGAHARYEILPARRGTRSLGLPGSPGHTDLARSNPAAERALAAHEVLHATAPFALSGAALRVAARHGSPLASSVHTDNPAFTRHYMPEMLTSVVGDFAWVRALTRRLGVAELGARGMARRVARTLGAARHLFYSNRHQCREFARAFPAAARSRLRRGIDRARFHPGLRDRAQLAQRFGIAPAVPVLAFAGRIDGSKNADLVADISERLWAWGVDHRLLMLGEGGLRDPLRCRLGDRALLPGVVPQGELAWMLASADAFVFPSETETAGNVALEALAAGLPLFVMADTAPVEIVRHMGEDGFAVATRDSWVWARMIAPLLIDSERLARHRGYARRAGALLPSWRDVLDQDLAPVWQRLAVRAASRRHAPWRQSAEAAD